MEQRWRDHLRNNCCRVIPGLVFGRRSRTSDHDRAWGNKPPRPQLSTGRRNLQHHKRCFFRIRPGSDRLFLRFYRGRQLSWLDRTGKVIEKVGPFMAYADLALSPDQKRAAVQLFDNDLWVVDLIRGIPSLFTFNPSTEDYPVWSPDGARVLFNFNPSGPADIYWK